LVDDVIVVILRYPFVVDVLDDNAVIQFVFVFANPSTVCRYNVVVAETVAPLKLTTPEVAVDALKAPIV
jgi:hypothetical protein